MRRMLGFFFASIFNALFAPKTLPGIEWSWSARAAESEDNHEAMMAGARDNNVYVSDDMQYPVTGPF